MSEVQEIFKAMPTKFNADKAAGVNVTYQFDITGNDGGKWYAKIANSQLQLAEGESPSPTTTVVVSADDWVKITKGQLNPQMAFMTGKLKIKGDMGAAMKMGSLFKLA